MIEITPVLNNEAPLYFQLYEYLKAEIQNGNILAKTKLPSQRSLAKHLSISRNTVDAAYQQLLSEGYLVSKEREGLYVIELEKDYFQKRILEYDEIKNKSNHVKDSSIIKFDFKYGDINLKDFPYKIWRKLSMQSLNEEQSHLLAYGDAQGEPELRNYIAKYLYEARGVKCSGEPIVIGAVYSIF